MTALGQCGQRVAETACGSRNLSGEVNTPILEIRPAPVIDERKAVMLQPDDFGDLVVAVACLHPRAHVARNRDQADRAGVLL